MASDKPMGGEKRGLEMRGEVWEDGGVTGGENQSQKE